MKKLISAFLILFLSFLIGCGAPRSIKPYISNKSVFHGMTILNKSEYIIIDTIRTNINKYGNIFSYDVIIKVDSTYFLGTLSLISPDVKMGYAKGRLVSINKFDTKKICK